MFGNFDAFDIGILSAVLVLVITLVATQFFARKAPAIAPIQSQILVSPQKKASIIDKLAGLGNDAIVLFYGSQTGTASDLAERTRTDLMNLNIDTVVCDFDDFEMQELALMTDKMGESRRWTVGFFVATYGEGEPTDNAVEFYKWITNGNDLSTDDEMTQAKVCNSLPYFVFGLGNTTYEHYNAVGKRLDQRLFNLGAKRILPIGLGDDDKSLEDDFLSWKKQALHNIATFYGKHISTTSSKLVPHIPRFIEVSSGEQEYHGELSNGAYRKWFSVKSDPYGKIYEENSMLKYDAKHPFYARIIKSESLFQGSFDISTYNDNQDLSTPTKALMNGSKLQLERQCYHIELDLGISGLTYETGDHVGVWAENDIASVNILAKCLGYSDIDTNIELKCNQENKLSVDLKLPFPSPCSIRTALQYYLDINEVVKQHIFEIISKFAANTEERDLLWKISEDREFYIQTVEKPQKSLAQICVEFPSVKVPFGVLAEIVSKISLRYYSISSSSLESPSAITITAVVVRYPISQISSRGSTQEKIVIKQGLATSWMERLHNERSSELLRSTRPSTPLYIRSSSFRLPSSPLVPVVMVGPGTGIAPFRAFLRERFFLASLGRTVGPTYLYFGCRNEKNDNLYSLEFESLIAEAQKRNLNIDIQVITAFSRDGPSKVYVQDRLKENGRNVWDLIGIQNGIFYVCGDAKRMAQDVNSTLEQIGIEHGGLDAERSKDWVKSLKDSSRYLEDVWA